VGTGLAAHSSAAIFVLARDSLELEPKCSQFADEVTHWNRSIGDPIGERRLLVAKARFRFIDSAHLTLMLRAPRTDKNLDEADS